MSAILIFWLSYCAVMACGFGWMFWHSGRVIDRNRKAKQERRDLVAIRLIMEGKQ